MADRTYYKSDCSELDYNFNWSTWLPAGDTISSYTLTVLSGDLVIVSDSELDSKITYWVTGTYGTIECEITSAQGRVECKTAEFIAR